MQRFSLFGLFFCSAAASAQAPLITPAQVANVFERQKDGGEYVPGYDLSLKLGVPTDAQNPYQVHYFARAFTSDDGVEHSIGRSKETGDYLIVVRNKTRLSYIHADRDFKFVGGAYYRYKESDPPRTIRPEETAVALLRKELIFWAGLADKN